MELRIRDAREADLPAIDAIYNHYVDHSTCTWQYAPTTPAERQAWFRGRALAHPVIVAVAGDDVVGWGSLAPFRPREGYRFTVENAVYVRADSQRRGVGSALLDELVRRAQATGGKSVMACISAEQAGSVALHARHGFVEVGRIPAVGFKWEQWLDLVIMQRRL